MYRVTKCETLFGVHSAVLICFIFQTLYHIYFSVTGVMTLVISIRKDFLKNAFCEGKIVFNTCFE